MKYIVALDQGTTSSRTIIYDKDMNAVSTAQQEFRQIYPQPGWIEHDPYDILNSQLDTLRAAVEKAHIDPRDIEAIGLANQRETTLVWDRETGKPIYNAIVWQCRRTAPFCEELKKEGADLVIQHRSGLVIDAYFAGTKIKWILDNVPGARAAAQAGKLAFGTVDTWLIWNLTGGKRHVTDVTNASRTMLFNISTCQWDDELLSLMDVPRSMLPEILPNCADFGIMDASVLGAPIPICGVAGDQHSALFGQNCVNDGEAKNTYGTGCFLLMKTGDKPIFSKSKLLTTIAWDLGAHGAGPQYALEGSIFMGGATIQWLRDEMKMISTSAESESVALQVPDSAGVYVVPAFTGLGAPWWDMYARGTIVGMTRGTGRAHIVRAALEAIAYQSYDVLTAMQTDTGITLKNLKVDGGATANNLLMQFQADLLGVPVIRPRSIETTAMGCAYLAGIHTGFFSGTQEISENWKANKIFRPGLTAEAANEKLTGWHRAVERAAAWAEK